MKSKKGGQPKGKGFIGVDVAGAVSTSTVHRLVAELWKQIVKSVGLLDDLGITDT